MNKKVKVGKDYLWVCAPSTCPHCGKGIDPRVAKAFSTKLFTMLQVHVAYQCPICEQVFYAMYPTDLMASSMYHLNEAFMYAAVYGGHGLEKTFSEEINSLSPSFVKVYNQAYKAEQNGLDEVSGISYRRAFEFLVKDYAKSEKPEKAEAIEKQSLASCIKEYVNGDQPDSIFDRTAWLGNDFSHYATNHPEFNLGDLKKMIDICVAKIEARILEKKYMGGIQRKPKGNKAEGE